MKRFLALFLALVMVFGMVPAMGTVAKAETDASTETAQVTEKPFYGLTWDSVEMTMFGNLEDAPVMRVYNNNGVVSLSDSDAATIKATLDLLPEGMRYIRIANTGNALAAGAELVVYADAGVAQLKALVTEFIEEYYDLGGQLDGIILDTEYTAMSSWGLYGSPYGGHYSKNAPEGSMRDFYHQVVAHEKYLTDIRPLLEERGFVFYEEASDSTDRSEIWSMYPPQTIRQVMTADEQAAFFAKYGNCYSIWNKVMANRIAAYLTDAVYVPMAARYPNATVSDYTVTDTATWENYTSESGGVTDYTGNSIKVGNTSNENMYNSNPNSDFFKNGDTYLYKNILSHNEAVYDDDAYGSLMYNVNRFKSIYTATDTKKISAWIAEYDYSGRANSVKNSPYYTEFMYHLGLLDPLPFLVYMSDISDKFSGTAGQIKYNECMKVISEILNELTRVAGYSDRTPIETPQSWNDGFLLSGMYANGRNIWRLTPDITDGMTLADFKVSSSDPTFSINGNTITFPGGKILSDTTISTVGSCGYWIETAADVQPVITREEDRYANNPSFEEDFEGFDSGYIFNSLDTTPLQTWVSDSIISSTVSLSGTASESFTVPAAENAQYWEMKFSIPYSKKTNSNTGITTEVVLTETAEMALLTCGTDGGIKIVNNQVYYDSNGSYVLWDGVTLTPATTYKASRAVNYDTLTCDYSIHSNANVLIARVEDVPMKAVSQPVTAMGASVSNFQAITTKTDSDGNVTSTTTADATLSITAAFANEALFVEEYDGGKALALIGTATLDNVKLPENITAGDSYAMQQAWEMSFTLSEALSSGSVTLFNGMVKLEGGKLYYNANGSYVALADIAAGTKYTINVNNNFTANTATYTLSADGAVAAQAADVAVTAVTLPVETITMAATDVTAKVYIDDYKLYPTGLEYTLKLYDGDTGIIQSATEQLTNDKVAFRLSWMNATSGEAKGQICVNDGNSTQVLKTIVMQPGWDGVETGVLENTTGKLTVYLKVCEKANTTLVGAVEATCTTDGYTGDLICNDCGEIYEQGSVITAAGHTKELIKGTAASCTTTGLSSGYKCSVCGEILVAQEVVPAKGHTEVVTEGYAATCTEDGKTDKIKCSVCGQTLQAQTTIPALGHTESDPVQENVTAGSCTEGGSYDLVVYCATCGEELSRETVTVEAVGHTEETVAGTAATCTEDGLTEGKKCSVCGEILVAQEVIPATGHTEAAYVKENVTLSSYDRVVYCSVCGEELSRQTVEAYTASVTLWGTKVTVDTDETDDENPAAYYWVNGEEGAVPVAATAEDAWNYSFTIIDGRPTVTLRNAEFHKDTQFLKAQYNGELELKYEGTNNFLKVNTTAFMTFAGSNWYKGHLYITGAEDAVLNVKGNGYTSSTIVVNNRVSGLTISGGTINLAKYHYSYHPVISAGYVPTVIENCTLSISTESTTTATNNAAIVCGYGSTGLTVSNSNITVDTVNPVGIAAGVMMSDNAGYGAMYNMYIKGDSNIVVNVNTLEDKLTGEYKDGTWMGAGLYANNVYIEGGNLEISASNKAISVTSDAAAPDLSGYDGTYEMYTAADGEPVTEYAATTYFKIKNICAHEIVTVPGKDATCTEPGLTEGQACSLCGEVFTAQEEIPATGHTEETLPAKAATCTETGLTEGKQCSVCGEILVAQETVEATGHSYDDEFDADCNECGEAREAEATVIVTADNYLQLVDSNANHIYHRVIPYFLGDQTVADITDEDALKAIDPDAETYWGASQIDSKLLDETGNYVLVWYYNDTELNGKKITTYIEVSVVVPELALPQVAVQDHTLVATEGDASIINYRAVVYYLGNKTVSDIYNINILKAMDPSAKTYWGLSDINQAQLWESGNYVIHLNYNIGKGVKQTVALAYTNEFSEITIDVIGGNLVAADPDNAYVYHRAIVYYVGDELVDPDNEAEVQAAAITTTTYWGLEDINKAKLTKPGNYVVVLRYNLPNSPKMSIAIDACI